GGAADAELLHPFDQARLRITRRRLGEMLLGLDLLLGGRVALAQPRQAAAVLVLGPSPGLLAAGVHRIVAAFLVQGEEAREEHDLASGAQGVTPGAVGKL